MTTTKYKGIPITKKTAETYVVYLPENIPPILGQIIASKMLEDPEVSKNMIPTSTSVEIPLGHKDREGTDEEIKEQAIELYKVNRHLGFGFDFVSSVLKATYTNPDEYIDTMVADTIGAFELGGIESMNDSPDIDPDESIELKKK